MIVYGVFDNKICIITTQKHFVNFLKMRTLRPAYLPWTGQNRGQIKLTQDAQNNYFAEHNCFL